MLGPGIPFQMFFHVSVSIVYTQCTQLYTGHAYIDFIFCVHSPLVQARRF